MDSSSGPAAIKYEWNGRPHLHGGMSEDMAARLLPDIRERCPDAEIVPDGLAETREMYPEGSRVRPTEKAYWKRSRGTVVSGPVPSSLPGVWPPEGTVATWYINSSGPSVCVEFDGDGYSGWWPLYMIEPL